MKRTIPLILMLLLGVGLLGAADLQVGVLGGLRTVADSGLSDVYGSGLAITPFAAIGLTKGVSLGAAFTFGYSKEAPIGLFDDPSKLCLSSLELFGRYRFEAGKVDPYVKAGVAFTSYSQTIAAAGIDLDESAAGLLLGAGAEYPVGKKVSLIGELGYTLLKVDPLGTKVNLGGFRFQVGAAYAFTL